MSHQSDVYWISVAFEQSLIPYSVKRNPRVGAVIVDKSGLVISKGFHDGYGTAHAEQVVLDVAKSRAKGATLYVNLAPCNHVGKTPSCCVEIINKGIKRVVYSQEDPNPLSVGNIEFLKANGVEVNTIKTPKQFESVNKRWFKSFEYGRPFVTAKIAITIDGKIGCSKERTTKITGKESLIEVHQLRNGCDAIVTGTGTVLVDNARLNVRYPTKVKTSCQPLRCVVGDREVKADALINDNSAETVFLQRMNPKLVLEQLENLDIRTVLVESGPSLVTQFLKQDLVDELIIYMAPTVIGQGQAIIEEVLNPISVGDFKISSVGLVGQDLRFKVSLR
jgi:diaminohydroxyphosphoribosylaminopyrimidine deaminase/5-amino-6-(5-phosphoribosylamino)uracil reductase